MIDEKTIRMALTSLGYRLPDGSKDRMIKPFGLSFYIFFFPLDILRLSSHFYSAQGELVCWSSAEFKDRNDDMKDFDSFSRAVSYQEECLSHHHFMEHGPYGFLTQEEKTKFMLEGVI
jgi:hypothetical protein